MNGRGSVSTLAGDVQRKCHGMLDDHNERNVYGTTHTRTDSQLRYTAQLANEHSSDKNTWMLC